MLDGLVDQHGGGRLRLVGLHFEGDADRFGRHHGGIAAQGPEDFLIVDDRGFVGPAVTIEGAAEFVFGEAGFIGADLAFDVIHAGVAFEDLVLGDLMQSFLDAFEPLEGELMIGDVPDGLEFGLGPGLHVPGVHLEQAAIDGFFGDSERLHAGWHVRFEFAEVFAGDDGVERADVLAGRSFWSAAFGAVGSRDGGAMGFLLFGERRFFHGWPRF
jgi:hypothetical protein